MEEEKRKYLETMKDPHCRQKWMEEKTIEIECQKMVEEEIRLRQAQKKLEIERARQSLRSSEFRVGCRRQETTEEAERELEKGVSKLKKKDRRSERGRWKKKKNEEGDGNKRKKSADKGRKKSVEKENC